MALVDEVRSKMMTAMKTRDTKKKEVLSSLLAALKDGVINKRADLTQEEETAIVSRELKQTKETMESAPADRTEIIEECRYKMEVLSEFVPKQMEESEILAVIDQVLEKLNIDSPTAKDKGKIMKELMPLVKGKADGKLVNDLVAKRFN